MSRFTDPWPDVARDARVTIEALMWLWTCEAGHWRNRDFGGRFYGPDEGFQPILATLSERFPMPAEHGIVLEVSDDRQAWRAKRQLDDGSWLAVGAVAGPPDMWCYDGTDEPPPIAEPPWLHMTSENTPDEVLAVYEAMDAKTQQVRKQGS